MAGQSVASEGEDAVGGESESRGLGNRVERIWKQQTPVAAQKNLFEELGFDASVRSMAGRNGWASARGRSRTSLIETAQLSLFELEKEGCFVQCPITPQSEYPTFLTRLPVFIPAKRCHQREMLDHDNALPFSTSWGQGRKHGPPLTVYDEDTLIAIGRLRQNRLVGKPHRLPIPVSDLYRRTGQNDVQVHVVQCLLSDIQKICKTREGGKNNQMRLESLKRLGTTIIEFTRTSGLVLDKQCTVGEGLGRLIGKGSAVKLLDIAWDVYEKNAVLYIQFSPVMALWFEREYTFIDWDLRLRLTDTGKAIHRFLSGQPKDYQIATKKLATTIGYMRGHNKFLVDLRESMEDMKSDRWIQSYEVVGTGRSVPHKLIIHRE